MEQTTKIGFCTCGSLSNCLKAWSIIVRFWCCDFKRTIASEDELQKHLADPEATVVKVLGSGIEGPPTAVGAASAARRVLEQVRLADEGSHRIPEGSLGDDHRVLRRLVRRV